MKPNFVKLTKGAEALLEELCQKWNETKDNNERLNMLNNISKDKAADSETKRNELIGLIKELKEAKYITASFLCGSGRYYYPLRGINMSIETYRKRLEEYIAFQKKINASGSVTNIDNSTTHNSLNITGGNNALKDVSVSSGNNKEPKRDEPKTNLVVSILKGAINLIKGLIFRV